MELLSRLSDLEYFLPLDVGSWAIANTQGLDGNFGTILQHALIHVAKRPVSIRDFASFRAD